MEGWPSRLYKRSSQNEPVPGHWGYFHRPNGPSREQMIPAWSLGVILLGYIFGFPVPFNSTQNGTRQYEYETLPQLNNTVVNSTQPFMSNDTESNETESPFPFQPEETWNSTDTEYGSMPEELMQSRNETDSNSTLPMYRDPPPLMHIRKIQFPVHEYYAAAPQGCVVSLCALINLGHVLNQGGDESAGGATRDPHGNGKR